MGAENALPMGRKRLQRPRRYAERARISAQLYYLAGVVVLALVAVLMVLLSLSSSAFAVHCRPSFRHEVGFDGRGPRACGTIDLSQVCIESSDRDRGHPL